MIREIESFTAKDLRVNIEVKVSIDQTFIRMIIISINTTTMPLINVITTSRTKLLNILNGNPSQIIW